MLKVANSVINASQIATPIVFTRDVTISTNSAGAALRITQIAVIYATCIYGV
jgi:hypothetical protein